MKFLSIFFICVLSGGVAFPQWIALPMAPHSSGNGMVLLSDGTVLVKSLSGGSDGFGNLYDRLTPDIHGNYATGTWTTITPMANTRLYYSTQVLKDGRVYVAGGEYGTGLAAAEIYNPTTNSWSTATMPGSQIIDASSAILDDGRILQSLPTTSTQTIIYNPVTNAYVVGPTALASFSESTWLKLPDNSELYVNFNNTSSERYIPATNTWIADGTLPVNLWDPFVFEEGGAMMLPNGRALFFGSTGHNAYYAPSGTTAPGTWTAAPDFPAGMGTSDAPAAMTTNGLVLCAASPIPTAFNVYPTPTSFYLFDPVGNAFIAMSAPEGPTRPGPAYQTTFLVLPDGSILCSRQFSNQYYVYSQAALNPKTWRPVINSVTQTGPATYLLTGTQFNGLSEGATYGDDWQMNTNYPIVRLVSGTNVYYARTTNWNSTGIQRGSAPDNVTFTLPAGLPPDTYTLYVVANGIPSLGISFSTVCASNVTLSGHYATLLTQSSNWIKATVATVINPSSVVKLDADPVAGYIELNPATTADYFLAVPTTTGTFIAQTLDGCGGGIPARPSAPEKPIITTTKMEQQGPPIPPHRKYYDRSITKTANINLEDNNITIFPNPAKESFLVQSNDDIQNATLQLFGIDGKLQPVIIENINSHSKKVKWNYLSSGVYTLKIISGKKTDVAKIVVP